MSTPALALYQRPGDLRILEYTRLADAGDLEGARALSDRLDPARDAFDRAWLGLVGLPQGPVRPPLVPLAHDEELALRRDLEAADLA